METNASPSGNDGRGIAPRGRVEERSSSAATPPEARSGSVFKCDFARRAKHTCSHSGVQARVQAASPLGREFPALFRWSTPGSPLPTPRSQRLCHFDPGVGRGELEQTPSKSKTEKPKGEQKPSLVLSWQSGLGSIATDENPSIDARPAATRGAQNEHTCTEDPEKLEALKSQSATENREIISLGFSQGRTYTLLGLTAGQYTCAGGAPPLEGQRDGNTWR